MAELNSTYGRVINNVSMAMPHAGVLQAAADTNNGIIQVRTWPSVWVISKADVK